MYPDDVDPQSGCRLPLPDRDEQVAPMGNYAAAAALLTAFAMQLDPDREPKLPPR